MNELRRKTAGEGGGARWASLVRRLQLTLKRAGRHAGDESGSAMVFGTLTLLTVTTTVLFVINLGVVSSDRMQLQNAADAAAYSAALVEANSLNSIAAINDGMAFIQFNLSRYAVDVVVTTAFAGIENHHLLGSQAGPLARPARRQAAGDDDIGRSELRDALGVQSATEAHRKATRRARDFLPKGEEWLARLSRTQHVIALATPGLVRRTAERIGDLNGAAAISVLGRDFFVGSGGSSVLEEDPDSRRGEISDAFARRYAGFDLGTLDGGQDRRDRVGGVERLPEWWDPNTGRLKVRRERRYGRNVRRFDPPTPQNPAPDLRALAGDPVQPQESLAYYQHRDCWNFQDEQHDVGVGPHESFPGNILGGPNGIEVGLLYAYDGYDEAPNGHWHELHVHIILVPTPFGDIPVPIPHRAGHFDEGAILHELARETAGSALPLPYFPYETEEHHAVTQCPTCGAKDHDGDKLTDIRYTPDDLSKLTRLTGISERRVLVGGGLSGPDSLRRINIANAFGTAEWPRPLMIRRNALREPIRVAVWRPRRSAIANRIFANPGEGMVAIASARVASLGEVEEGIIGPRRPAKEFPWTRGADEEKLFRLEQSFLEPTNGFSARLTVSRGPSAGNRETGAWWRALFFGDGQWRRGDGNPDGRPIAALSNSPLKSGVGENTALDKAVRH